MCFILYADKFKPSSTQKIQCGSVTLLCVSLTMIKALRMRTAVLIWI